mmetsp:Transcript_79957/g.259094  ORF Transcript_79957/g.259094 Transcript_79957/m.259094 type:complete len:661 (-) Transcript_79957:7567-9549(-)
MLAEAHFCCMASAFHCQQLQIQPSVTTRKQWNLEWRHASRRHETDLNIAGLTRPQSGRVDWGPLHKPFRQFFLVVAELERYCAWRSVNEPDHFGHRITPSGDSEIHMLHFQVCELQTQWTTTTSDIDVHVCVIVHDELNPLHVVTHFPRRKDDRDSQGAAGLDHRSIQLHIKPRLARESGGDQAISVVAVRRNQLDTLVPVILGMFQRLTGHRRTILRDEARAEVISQEGKVHTRPLGTTAQRNLEDRFLGSGRNDHLKDATVQRKHVAWCVRQLQHDVLVRPDVARGLRNGKVRRFLELVQRPRLAVALLHLDTEVEVFFALVRQVQIDGPLLLHLHHAKVQVLQSSNINAAAASGLLNSQGCMDGIATALDVQNDGFLLPLDVAYNVEVERTLLHRLEGDFELHKGVRPDYPAARGHLDGLREAFDLETGLVDGEAEGDVLFVDQTDLFRGGALEQLLAELNARLIHANTRLLHNANDQEVLDDLLGDEAKVPEGLLRLDALRCEFEDHLEFLPWEDGSSLGHAAEGILIVVVVNFLMLVSLLHPHEIDGFCGRVKHIKPLRVLNVGSQTHDLCDTVLRIQRSICLTTAAVVTLDELDVAPWPQGRTSKQHLQRRLVGLETRLETEQLAPKVFHLHRRKSHLDLPLPLCRHGSRKRRH